MATGDRIFLDTDVALDHLADLQPFAESAIISRNKANYAASEIPVMSPDEFLALGEPPAE